MIVHGELLVVLHSVFRTFQPCLTAVKKFCIRFSGVSVFFGGAGGLRSRFRNSALRLYVPSKPFTAPWTTLGNKPSIHRFSGVPDVFFKKRNRRGAKVKENYTISTIETLLQEWRSFDAIFSLTVLMTLHIISAAQDTRGCGPDGV